MLLTPLLRMYDFTRGSGGITPFLIRGLGFEFGYREIFVGSAPEWVLQCVI